MGLNEKILIVTGSSPIASAASRMAVADGARLLLATGDGEFGWDLAASIGAECWVGDLTQPAGAESILSHCLSKFGRVDALFHAAGLSGRRFGDGPVHECTDEGWDLTLAHNLRSTFYMCRAVIGRMLEQRLGEDGERGSVLTTSSVLAESPERRHFPTHAYAAAKGGVVALTRSMASYYAPHHVRVNAIAPGLVRTPVSERAQAPELMEFMEKKQPLSGGMTDAEDVARAAIFLLGSEARSITGEVLTVDAGWRFAAV
jgi:NAD(P)-dependent dehydrogenase (short-subunit alcohol dehydrogenase family)